MRANACRVARAKAFGREGFSNVPRYFHRYIYQRGGLHVNDFKQFLLRGNVVDFAVGVVMGAAFGTVVTALVKDFITPLIAAMFGKPDFSAISFTVNGATFAVGDFINAVVAFSLVALAVFFFVVKPVNFLMSRARQEPPADPTTMKCPECMSEIPKVATRCAFCTTVVAPAA